MAGDLVAGVEAMPDELETTRGALLSLVSAFLRLLPLRISFNKASLPFIDGGGTFWVTEGAAEPRIGGGGGGGGGGPDIGNFLDLLIQVLSKE